MRQLTEYRWIESPSHSYTGGFGSIRLCALRLNHVDAGIWLDTEHGSLETSHQSREQLSKEEIVERHWSFTRSYNQSSLLTARLAINNRHVVEDRCHTASNQVQLRPIVTDGKPVFFG